MAGSLCSTRLLFGFWKFLKHRGNSDKDSALIPLTSSLLFYGIFQTLVGLVIMLPPGLERLRPFEPMRYLHLLYVLFFLLVGGVLGCYVLQKHLYRWFILFVPLSPGMFYAQAQMYPASRHLEMPWTVPTDSWLQAFSWIRSNTPVDALFALDPHYETQPDEDYHGFRALAERSALADVEKDGGMAARVPRLAPRWLAEVTALNGWRHFQSADFKRLKAEFGVTWIVLSPDDILFSAPPTDTLACPYSNEQVRVCRLY